MAITAREAHAAAGEAAARKRAADLGREHVERHKLKPGDSFHYSDTGPRYTLVSKNPLDGSAVVHNTSTGQHETHERFGSAGQMAVQRVPKSRKRDAPMATTNAGMGASKEVVDDLQRKAKSITGSDFAADATERAMASKSVADHREAAKSHAAAVEAADAVGDMPRALHHEAMERLHHESAAQMVDSRNELARRVATGAHKYGAAASASVQPSAPSVIQPAHAAKLAAFRDQPGPAAPAVPAKAAAGVAGRKQKGEGKAVLQSKSGRSYFLTPGGHRRYID